MSLASPRIRVAFQALCGVFYTLMFLMAAVEGLYSLKLAFLGLLILSATCAIAQMVLRLRHPRWSLGLAGLPVAVLAAVVLTSIPQHHLGG